jgi:hypothetical protein
MKATKSVMAILVILSIMGAIPSPVTATCNAENEGDCLNMKCFWCGGGPVGNSSSCIGLNRCTDVIPRGCVSPHFDETCETHAFMGAFMITIFTILGVALTLISMEGTYHMVCKYYNLEPSRHSIKLLAVIFTIYMTIYGCYFDTLRQPTAYFVIGMLVLYATAFVVGIVINLGMLCWGMGERMRDRYLGDRSFVEMRSEDHSRM